MATCRTWWRNCALEADAEIATIDRMEDAIAPISPDITNVRELISSLELCHHKAAQWVYNIIEAIGAERTTKGLGTRKAEMKHPVEEVWENACLSLQDWCSGSRDEKNNVMIGNFSAAELIAGLGERTPLKEWQVQRVIEKIRSVVNWSASPDEISSGYKWMLLGGGEYESAYRDACPEYFKDHEDFWMATVKTFILDKEHDDEASLSLALAIDMLWPCHWRFLENLRIVLNAIGGNLQPDASFGACGRNIQLVPNQRRLQIICNSLEHFCDRLEHDKEIDFDIVGLLGQSTEVNRWLAASLDKTIRLQLDPPSELREIAALNGPAWIHA